MRDEVDRHRRAGREDDFLSLGRVDELPNFLNVIRGEMSLVGPRPEVPEVEALYGKYSNKYLSVKPGITCISKITGRDYLTKEETIKLDLEYVDQMSLRLNAKIMWVTFERVLFHRDVFYKRGPQKESTMVHSEDDNIELTLADKNSRASSRAASM